MSSRASTKKDTVEIDNSKILESSTPKPLKAPSAKEPAKKSEPNQAVDKMVGALSAEIEQTMEEMKAVWEVMDAENEELYVGPKWI
ncbi:hypothetical protein HYE68_010369 [Fusarium pseudograminearum]|nr:hypothetical protein HYE68_010369 [Fusarium pseudograminearum]